VRPRVLAVPALTFSIAGALPAAQPPQLQVEPSPMRLRASGASYSGVKKSMTREEFERARKEEYWQEVQWNDTVFFPGHVTSMEDGLGAYTLGTARSTAYPMSALAIATGWYKPPDDERYFPDFIHGVALGGGRIWMGTIGLGIVARDVRDGTWSRHDVKAKGLPGIHSMVFYADDEYVLGKSGGPTGGWKDRLPEVREGDLGPALEVYSIRRDRWLRVRSIPRENVIEFGWTSHPGVSIQCDTRRYARAPVMPLEMCTWPDYGKAAPGGYELGYTFNEPGAPLRFVIRKNQLDAAFDWLGER
jgi:hypothetical protein